MFGYGGTRTARDAFCFQTEPIQLDPSSQRTPLLLSLLPSALIFMLSQVVVLSGGENAFLCASVRVGLLDEIALLGQLI